MQCTQVCGDAEGVRPRNRLAGKSAHSDDGKVRKTRHRILDGTEYFACLPVQHKIAQQAVSLRLYFSVCANHVTTPEKMIRSAQRGGAFLVHGKRHAIS
jgi:hypothetical protein